MKHILLQHLNYNLWANTKMADTIRKVDDELFDREVTSSFPSLRKTLFHMWDAEKIWLNRLNGVSLSEWPSKSFTGSKEEGLSGFHENSKKFAEFYEGKDRSFLESPITFTTMSGQQVMETPEGIAFHVVNHGSFHRGQLVTILRMLGITEIPATDLIRYLRES